MKTFSKVVIIAVAVLLALGLAFTVFGFMTGAVSWVYWDRDGLHVPQRGRQDNAASQAVMSQSDLEAFTSVDIDADLADIRFIPSDGYGFEIAYSDQSPTPMWSVDNGRLKITKRDPNSREGNRWFNVDFSRTRWFNIDLSFLPFVSDRDIDEHIYIYYPRPAEFDKLKLSVALGSVEIGSLTAGDISINSSFGSVGAADINCRTFSAGLSAGALSVKNISATTFSVKNSFGESIVTGVTSSTLDINVNSGALELTDCRCGSADISNDFGAVKLTRFTADWANLTLNSGKLDMRNVTVEDIDISNDFGETAGRDIDFGAAKVRSGAGKIQLAGDIRGADIKADFGSIELALTRPRDYYSYDLRTDLGSIRVDSDRYSGTAASSVSGGGDRPLLKVSANSGSIDISFGR